MEIKIEITGFKLSKKKIVLFLVVPILVIGIAIYLYFFWGKPLNVRHDIWITGKTFYEHYIGDKDFKDVNEGKQFTEKLVSLMYEYETSHKSDYTSNEYNILHSIEFTEYEKYCSDSEYVLYVDEENCKIYNNSIETLASYYE